MSLANFPTAEGTYTVTPAIRDEATGTWYDIPVWQSLTYRYLTATVSGSTITFENPEDPEAYIVVSNIQKQEKAYAGQSYTLSATIKNTGSSTYSKKVALGLLKSNTSSILAMSSWTQLTLSGGESRDMSFTMTLPSETGSYQLVIFSETGAGLSDLIPVTIEGSATGAAAFELAAPITIENSNSVDPSKFKMTAKVKCTSGSYSNPLYTLIFPEGSTSNYTEYLYVANFSINMGETKEVTFTGSLSKVEEGKSYTASVWFQDTDGYVTQIPYGSGSPSATFTVASADAGQLTATNLATSGNLYTGQSLTATATIKRTGSAYSGNVIGVLLPQGSKDVNSLVTHSDYIAVNVAANGSQNITFSMTLPSTAGKYNLAVVDEDLALLCEPLEINVIDEPVVAAEMKVSAPLRVANAESVDPENFSVEADITCTSGSYSGTLLGIVYPTDMTDIVLAEIKVENFTIEAGETKTITFKGALEGSGKGEKYYATIAYLNAGGEMVFFPSDNNDNYAEFTTSTTSSIDDAASLSQPHDISIFTPSGICVARQTATQVDTSALAPGTYIIKEGSTVRKIVKE